MKTNLQKVAVPGLIQSMLDLECRNLWDSYPNLVDSTVDVLFHRGFGDYEVVLKAELCGRTIYVVRTDLRLQDAITDAYAALNHKLSKHQDRNRAKRFMAEKFKMYLGRLLPARQFDSPNA